MSAERGEQYLESVYLFGTPDEVIASLQARVDAGVEYFILHTMTPDPAQLRHWVDEIIPNVDVPADGRAGPPPTDARLRVVTRRVALLGKPLRRRHSQVMHDAAFAAAGIDARYVLAGARAGGGRGRGARRRAAPDWLGLGVTAPYKRVVAELVRRGRGGAPRDRRGEQRRADARTAGWSGFNSDAPGFRAGVELAMGRPLDGRRGRGRGRRRRGARGRLRLPGRRRPARSRSATGRWQRPTALAARLRGVGPGDRAPRSRSTARRSTTALGRADLAVNATTVGMVDAGRHDRGRAAAGRGDRLRPRLRAAPRRRSLAAARARGLRAANGSEMLIAQAAIAFERWTGVGGMADVMRAAVAPLLADPAARA